VEDFYPYGAARIDTKTNYGLGGSSVTTDNTDAFAAALDYFPYGGQRMSARSISSHNATSSTLSVA
jgi:hypothetical protein